MPHHTPAPTPSRAVYGFVMFLSLQLLFAIYLIWSLVPKQYFELVGFNFLPQRHWAVSVPIFILTATFIFGFVIYPSLGLLMTPHYDDIRTIMNKTGRQMKKNAVILQEDVTEDCICKSKEKCWKEYYKHDKNFIKKSIPAAEDLNIWDVSEDLYLNNM